VSELAVFGQGSSRVEREVFALRYAPVLVPVLAIRADLRIFAKVFLGSFWALVTLYLHIAFCRGLLTVFHFSFHLTPLITRSPSHPYSFPLTPHVSLHSSCVFHHCCLFIICSIIFHVTEGLTPSVAPPPFHVCNRPTRSVVPLTASHPRHVFSLVWLHHLKELVVVVFPPFTH